MDQQLSRWACGYHEASHHIDEDTGVNVFAEWCKNLETPLCFDCPRRTEEDGQMDEPDTPKAV